MDFCGVFDYTIRRDSRLSTSLCRIDPRQFRAWKKIPKQSYVAIVALFGMEYRFAYPMYDLRLSAIFPVHI